MTGGFRDITRCTIEPDEDGFWLLGTGYYTSGVNRDRCLFRRIQWFHTEEEAEAFFAENAPPNLSVKRMPAGDFEGTKWMAGSGAPNVLDDTDY